MSTGKINATYLQSFFTGSSEAEQTRLTVLNSTLQSSTRAEVSAACRDWSQGYKGNPKRHTVQTRCGEVRALKVALDTGTFSISADKGYHDNVAEARATLARANLTTSGKPRVDRAERTEQKKALAIAVKAVKLSNFDNSKVAENMPTASAEVARDTAKALARVVIQKHGLEIALYMSEILVTMVDEIQRGNKPADDQLTDEERQHLEALEVQAPEAAAA